MFKNSQFPEQWQRAVAVPIAKPNKDHTNSINYRPIALQTIALIFKILERIIKNRLLEYLEMNKILTHMRCGCRKRRSPEDHHLIRLETTIRETFASKQHCISTFYDIEKTYDTTWKYGILKEMRRIGLRGTISQFIVQFFQNRTFQVKIDCTYSEIYKKCEFHRGVY